MQNYRRPRCCFFFDPLGRLDRPRPPEPLERCLALSGRLPLNGAWLPGDRPWRVRMAALGDGEFQLVRDVDTGDSYRDDIPDFEAFRKAKEPRTEPDFSSTSPPVVHEVFVTNEPVNQPGLKLDVDAELGDAGDDAVVDIADVLLQEGQDFDAAKLAFGVFGAARSVKF